MTQHGVPKGPDRDAWRGAVLKEYARLAAGYDRRWSFYIRASARETLRRLPLAASDRVLDVGCGTGALLHELALAYPTLQLAGVDPSPDMLTVAREKLGPAVELQPAWADRLPYDDARFDVVVSCSVLHYLREPVAALREMARVVRPGGHVVLTDWCDDFLACRLCDRVLRIVSRAYFRAYGAQECGQLLRASGMEAVATERYRITWLWGLMTGQARKRSG